MNDFQPNSLHKKKKKSDCVLQEEKMYMHGFAYNEKEKNLMNDSLKCKGQM